MIRRFHQAFEAVEVLRASGFAPGQTDVAQGSIERRELKLLLRMLREHEAAPTPGLSSCVIKEPYV
jgi:hypothetical protein